MEIEHMREFVVFAETLNYSIAAKKLFIAQPTLSQHIKKMEQELGFALVDRGPKPGLTNEGAQFHIRIQRLLHDYDNIVASCAKTEPKPEGHSVCTLNLPGLPNISALIAAQQEGEGREIAFVPTEVNPKSDYDAYLKYTEFELLDNGVVDIAFGFSDDARTPLFPASVDASHYRFAYIGPLKMLFCMLAEHPLAQCDSIASAPMKHWSLVENGAPLLENSVHAVSQALAKHGVTTTSIKSRGELVFDSLRFDPECLSAIFETSRHIIEPAVNQHGLIVKEFNDATITVQCFAICRADNPNPQVIQAMDALQPTK